MEHSLGIIAQMYDYNITFSRVEFVLEKKMITKFRKQIK